MVDVPRFELGASSMPRKRASKLRHTPNILTPEVRRFKERGCMGVAWTNHPRACPHNFGDL